MTSHSHIPRFTLERDLAGELEADQRRDLEAHLTACAACTAEREALAADDAAFRAEVPYADFRIEHERRRDQAQARGRWARLWLPGLTAAVTAAGVLLFAVQPAEEPSGVRAKGGAALSFSVLEEGGLRPGITGELLQPGARMQLAYSATGFTHMALVGIDAAGRLSLYFPKEGDALAPLPSGPSGSLPFSLTLDTTPGVERFVAVFARRAASLAPLLDAAGRASADASVRTPLALPQGWAQSSFWIRKPSGEAH